MDQHYGAVACRPQLAMLMRGFGRVVPVVYGVAMSMLDAYHTALSCGDVAERTIARHVRGPGGLATWLRATRAPVYARLCASYVAPEHWREIVLYLIEVAGGLAVDAMEERPELARQCLDHEDIEPLLASSAADVRQSALLLLGAVRARGGPHPARPDRC